MDTRLSENRKIRSIQAAEYKTYSHPFELLGNNSAPTTGSENEKIYIKTIL
jgi:hypothetical protein